MIIAVTDQPALNGLACERVVPLLGTTVAQYQQAEAHHIGSDGNFLPGTWRRCWLASNHTGQLVGYADLLRAHFMPPGSAHLTLAVAKGQRGQGFGGRLLAEVEAHALQQGLTSLEARVAEASTAGFAFAEKHGYGVKNHEFESVLALVSFPFERFMGAIGAAEARGIRFFTLADEPGEVMEQALMALEQRTCLDDPLVPADRGEITLAEWRRWHLEGPGYDSRWVFLAAHEGQLVGTTLMQRRSPDEMYTLYTGVERAYRGYGLALALKVLSFKAAEAAGAKYMVTNNDSVNHPMLAINQKLGYEPRPGTLHVTKQLLDGGKNVDLQAGQDGDGLSDR